MTLTSSGSTASALTQHVALAFAMAIAVLSPVPWGLLYVFPLMGAAYAAKVATPIRVLVAAASIMLLGIEMMQGLAG